MGYSQRAALEERERVRQEARDARDAERERERWTLDKLFDAHKHMSTMSATALVLVFAAYRIDLVDVDVLLGMVSFGFTLIVSLHALRTTLLAEQAGKRTREDVIDISFGEFVISVALFVVGVLFVVVWPSVEAQIRGG